MSHPYEEIFRLGADDAANWRPSQAKNFKSISEQLAYRKGYDSVANVRGDNDVLSSNNGSTFAVPHQRIGAQSNADVGAKFEQVAKSYFSSQGIDLQFRHSVKIGNGPIKKDHAFDLGCDRQKILVECKSHRWTIGANIPSAKLTVWNEAMYYFDLAPADYRKIMFVLHHKCERRAITLAEYYLATYAHLIPEGVEFFEYDEEKRAVRSLDRGSVTRRGQ